MPFFRISDDFADHPKVLAAGNGPVGLWVRCGAYSSHHGLDGCVPDALVRQWGTRREIDQLIVTRLWVPCDDGFRLPDFLAYNFSAAQVRAQRDAAAERKRRARERRENGDGNEGVTP